MIRKSLLLIVICAFAKQLFSQEYNLTLRVKSEPYMDGVYFHKGKYRNHDYWVGPDVYNTYFIAFSDTSSKWIIGKWTGDTNKMEEITGFNSSSSSNFPLSGWPDGLRVRIEAPTLWYSSLSFVEDQFNTGTLTDTIIIQHNKKRKQAFSGKKGDDLILKNWVNVYALPTGLVPHILHINDSTLQFWISGHSFYHHQDSFFTLEFTDGAFTNNGTKDSTYDAEMKIKLDFFNVVKVGFKNSTYSRISDALKGLTNDDVLEVGEGTFTECSIMAPKNLTRFKIRGRGPDKTIVQADSLPQNAQGRVFDFTDCDSVILEDLTIQNGYVTESPVCGGGIYMNLGHLTLSNCRVIKNEIFSDNYDLGRTSGGGIYANRVRIINSEISENKSHSSERPSYAKGGGITVTSGSHIINTTISGNYSDHYGGGICMRDYNTKTTFIRNSTITNNEVSAGKGGGLAFGSLVEFENSIVYKNRAHDSASNDLTSINTVYVKNSILGNFDEQVFTIAGMNSLLKIDPKLDSLKFNCATTRTHALLPGSPAIGAEIPSEYTQFTDQRGYPKKKKGGDIGAHENNSQLDFVISQDTICRDTNSILVLKPGVVKKGIFEGRGVSNDTFDASMIKKSGFVFITYKYSGLNCSSFSKTDSIYVRLCNSEEIPEAPLNITYYPNPVEDVLQIEVYNDNEMSIQVCDLSGTKLHSQYSPDRKAEVNMTSLKPGFYVLTVSASGKSVSKKFIRLYLR